MATSDSRKGPGWWMASDGGWNPPEMWPESTPPLPGWVRAADGTWKAPEDVPPVAETPRLDLTEANSAADVIDLTAPKVSESTAATGATIARSGKTVELPAAKDVPTLQPRPTVSEPSVPAKPKVVQADNGDRPTLGFAPQSPTPAATSRPSPQLQERDPRVLAVWLSVAILACIAGLLAVLVLL